MNLLSTCFQYNDVLKIENGVCWLNIKINNFELQINYVQKILVLWHAKILTLTF